MTSASGNVFGKMANFAGASKLVPTPTYFVGVIKNIGDGRESEWTPGVGDGQRGLACCNSWGRKESDTTEQLN